MGDEASRSAAGSGAQADRAIGAGERRRGQRGGALGAVGEEGVDLRPRRGASSISRVRERREQGDQRVGQRRLERAEALAGEARAAPSASLSPVSAA